MSTNKISKVQLNNEQYSLKGDASNIKDVMLPTVDDIYSKITTGTDSATILLILENISGLLNGKADKSQINSIWSLIEALNNRIPNSTINYYFAYKVGSQTPQRPGNDETYVPYGWTGYPIIPNTYEVLYMTMARKANDEWFNWENNAYRWTLPIAFGGSKSSQSVNIEGNIALYKLSQGTPTLSPDERRTKAYPSGWSTTPDFASLGNKEIYMITAKTLNGDLVLVNNYYWSAPMRIGDGTTSGTGADGLGYNYIYALKPSSSSFSAPSFTVQQIEESSTHSITENGTTWYDRPQGVSEINKYEYISVSVGSDDNGWSAWSTPVVWSKWGEKGMDGDAVEYIYKRTESEQVLTLNLPYSGRVGNQAYSNIYANNEVYSKNDDFIPNGWEDNPSGVDENNPCEYVAIRKKKDEVWQPFEQPVLWAKYGKQGPPGVVTGYLITCNNSSVIADDDLFTKDNALDRFNALASATFKLIKTSGESITPQYALANDSVLPAGISAVSTFANSGVLTYTGSFTNAANIKDGDVYYVHINGLVNGEVVATIKQTIYVKNFSQGESYRLIVTPTAIEVSSDNKFKSTATINVKFLVIGDVLSTDVDFNRYQLKYKVEKNGNGSTLVGNEWTSQNCTLGNADSIAANYYVVNLYKTVNSADVLVDSQTVNTYKNGEQGILGISGAVIRYIGDWSSVVENANNHEFAFECNTPEGANVRYIDVVTMPATGGGLDYYQCKLAYITDSNSPSPNQDGNHWEPAQHFKFLVTDTLISNVIAAGSISANDVVIKEGEGLNQSIVAGMTSSAAKYSTLGDVRIWAGTEGDLPNILKAPFIVNNKGELYSENARIQGQISANGGTFNGDVFASSLAVIKDGNIALQFKVIPEEGITDSDGHQINIAAGTPALFAYTPDGDEYIIDMTKLSSGSSTLTVFRSTHIYPLVNLSQSESSIISALLNLCHTENGVCYLYARLSHVEANITRDLSCYEVTSSSDPELNGVITTSNNIDDAKNHLFTGYCIELLLESVLVSSGSDLNTGTYMVLYWKYYYNNGRKEMDGFTSRKLDEAYKIGTYHVENGNITSDVFDDFTRNTQMQTKPITTNYSGFISYSQYNNILAQVSTDPAPNPGQFD